MYCPQPAPAPAPGPVQAAPCCETFTALEARLSTAGTEAALAAALGSFLQLKWGPTAGPDGVGLVLPLPWDAKARLVGAGTLARASHPAAWTGEVACLFARVLHAVDASLHPSAGAATIWCQAEQWQANPGLQPFAHWQGVGMACPPPSDSGLSWTGPRHVVDQGLGRRGV